MKTRMISNWVLLIIAFLVSVLIWMFGIQEDNPDIEISLGKISVEILNEDVMHENNLAYWITDNAEVTVSVTVPQTKGWEVSASDIKLTADFSDWHPGFATIPIEVEVVNNRKIIGNQYRLSDNVIKVETEEMENKELNLDIQVQGTPASDYTVLSAVSSLEKIVVTAPASALEQIAKAEVTVDVEGQTEQVKEKSEIVLYDSDDMILDMEEEQIFLNHSSAKITAAIGKVKTVSLILPQAQGTAADGYACTGVSSNIEEIQVAGETSVIDQLTDIDLSNINLSIADAKEDVVLSVDISKYLPDGIQLVSTEQSTMELTAAIEELFVKVFTIQISDIEIKNQPKNRTCTFSVKSVKCQVRGLEQDMKTLTEESLNPSMDLKNTTQNSIVVSVELGIDENIYELVSKPLITVMIQ